jgi:hypothetical protein
MGLWGAVDRVDRSLGFRDVEGLSRSAAWQARRRAALRRLRTARRERQAVVVTSAAAGAGGLVAVIAVPAPGGLAILAGGAAVAAAAGWWASRMRPPLGPADDDHAPVWFPQVRRSSPAFPLLRRAVSARTVLDRVAAAGGPLALVVHDASQEGQRLVADLAGRVALLDDHVAQLAGLPAAGSRPRTAAVADLERAVRAYEELAGTVLVETYGSAGGAAAGTDPAAETAGRIAEFLARIEGVRVAARTTR